MFDRAVRVVVATALTIGVAFGSVALAHDGNGQGYGGNGHGYGGDRHRGDRHHHGHGSDQGGGPGSGCERYGSYSPWDKEYAETSMKGDIFEIRGGQLAQHNTSTTVVNKLGERLLTDHTKSLHEMEEAAKKLGIEVPSSPTPSEEWELHVVSTLSGHEFDVWYSELEVKDHMQDIEETEGEIKDGCNTAIQKLASEDLPVLKEHLKLSEEALAAAKSSSSFPGATQRH